MVSGNILLFKLHQTAKSMPLSRAWYADFTDTCAPGLEAPGHNVYEVIDSSYWQSYFRPALNASTAALKLVSPTAPVPPRTNVFQVATPFETEARRFNSAVV